MNDTNEANKKFQKELNAGIAALVLLSILERAEEPMYGYQIIKQIEGGYEEVPMMKQGSLYPVLRSMEKSGILESRVEPSVTGPPRRYYRITDIGRATLTQWRETWSRTKGFVDAVLKGISDA
jgi:PadR family transcriptional regulator PadR